MICNRPKFKRGLHKSCRSYVILDVVSITLRVTFGTKGLVNTLNIDVLTNVFQRCILCAPFCLEMLN